MVVRVTKDSVMLTREQAKILSGMIDARYHHIGDFLSDFEQALRAKGRNHGHIEVLSSRVYANLNRVWPITPPVAHAYLDVLGNDDGRLDFLEPIAGIL